MLRKTRLFLFHVALSLIFFFSTLSQAETPKVLTPELGYDGDPSKMMQQYFWDRIDRQRQVWQERYDAVKTREDAEKYQKDRVDGFRAALGAFPERTPLNPRITKTYKKDGFRAEMIVIETQPKFFLTAILFLPDETKWKAPYPAMLQLCGHSPKGKAYLKPQQTCVLAARHGIASLLIDPIDQGERHQWLRQDGKPYAEITHGHNLCNFGSIPLGRSAATYMTWDIMRSIDYLESRDDIDSSRIGATGASGGGTQTSYIMSLDPRITVAVPGCYLCSLYGKLIRTMGPQDGEQNIFGQLDFCMDHADFIMMAAPKPVLICATTRDPFPIEDTWVAFRDAKRFYDRFRMADRVSLIETDEAHKMTANMREAIVRWMVRWMHDRDELIYDNDDIPHLTEEESHCLEQRGVMRLEGARSVYDINRDDAKKFAEKRKTLWADGLTDTLRDEIRKRIVARRFTELPETVVEMKGKISLTQTLPKAGEVDVRRFWLRPEPGIVLPVIRWTPRKKAENSKPLLYLHGNGQAAGMTASGNSDKNLKPAGRSIDDFLSEGRTVVSADLRGLGETQYRGDKYFNHHHFGPDGATFYMGYLLGTTHVGMRTEDLWHLARWMRTEAKPIDVYSFGLPGTVVLHAAALEPDLFGSLEVEASLVSWSNLVDIGLASHPITDLVHDALTLYDIPELVDALGAKLKFTNPVNAQGSPAGSPVRLP